MKLIKTDFDGLFIIENFYTEDNRGSFTKVFNSDVFEKIGIKFSPKEIYYSISDKGVIRGMHFQTPPMDHAKLVYVVNGSIIDVVLDIRKKSRSYGNFFSIQLDAHQNSVFIPSGFAHGFRALENNTMVVYNQTSCYSKENDSGILWSSIGFEWGIKNPVVSERDKSFINFSDFMSVFE